MNLTITDTLASRYPTMCFAAVVIPVSSEFDAAVDHFVQNATDALARHENDTTALAGFDAFFQEHGHRLPLVPQIDSARKKGFPPSAPPAIRALLALEASLGILSGVQDADAIEGGLRLDLTDGPEAFVGMRGKIVSCDPGEIVVRDDRAIIASLFRGPDEHTAITPRSQNLIFYVFDAEPGMPEVQDRALATLARLAEDSGVEARTLRANG